MQFEEKWHRPPDRSISTENICAAKSLPQLLHLKMRQQGGWTEGFLKDWLMQPSHSASDLLSGKAPVYRLSREHVGNVARTLNMTDEEKTRAIELSEALPVRHSSGVVMRDRPLHTRPQKPDPNANLRQKKTDTHHRKPTPEMYDALRDSLTNPQAAARWNELKAAAEPLAGDMRWDLRHYNARRGCNLTGFDFSGCNLHGFQWPADAKRLGVASLRGAALDGAGDVKDNSAYVALPFSLRARYEQDNSRETRQTVRSTGVPAGVESQSDRNIRDNSRFVPGKQLKSLMCDAMRAEVGHNTDLTEEQAINRMATFSGLDSATIRRGFVEGFSPAAFEKLMNNVFDNQLESTRKAMAGANANLLKQQGTSVGVGR